MNEGLSNKISGDTEKGTVSEDLFIEIMTNDGYRCYKSSREENMREHWDVVTVKDNIFERYDIKSKKESHGIGFTWVELKNVRGNIGWIFSEYMDIIAFEKEDCFEFVRRNELAKLVVENIEKADLEDECGNITYCSKDNLGYYRKYSRIGREDVIVKVPFCDFEHLIYKTIYKKRCLIKHT